MAKFGKPGMIIIFALITAVMLSVYPAGRISGKAQPAAEIQRKLEGISENEKIILEELFILSQDIEEMDREQAELKDEIRSLETETEDVSNRIYDQQKDYNSKLDVLKQVLVSYQRRGPASYLNIILNARDLSSFLRSVNVIKDLTRNTGELLDSLELTKRELLEQREGLAENIDMLEIQKKRLEEAMEKKMQLRQEQEEYLNSLREEEIYYSELLDSLQGMWDQIKVLFSGIVEEFSEIIGQGKFSMDDLDLRYGLLNVRGTIRQEMLNDILKQHLNLTEIVFHFSPDKVEIEIPENHLVLVGTFVIEDGSVLKFAAEEGSFYEMALEEASIDELFRDGHLSIDFSQFMDNITLQSVKVCDGCLEFNVRPDF